MDNQSSTRAGAVLVLKGERADYWRLPDGTYNTDPNARSGYYVLASLLRLKGEPLHVHAELRDALKR